MNINQSIKQHPLGKTELARLTQSEDGVSNRDKVSPLYNSIFIFYGELLQFHPRRYVYSVEVKSTGACTPQCADLPPLLREDKGAGRGL
jgi:hypothetical protein